MKTTNDVCEVGMWVIYWRNIVTFASPRRKYVFRIVEEMANLSGMELLNLGEGGFMCIDKNCDMVIRCQYEPHRDNKINSLGSYQSSVDRARYFGKRHKDGK